MPQTDLLWSGRHSPKLYNAVNIGTHNGRSRRVEPTVTHWSTMFDILLLLTQTAFRKSSTHKGVQHATVSLVTKCHLEVRSLWVPPGLRPHVTYWFSMWAPYLVPFLLSFSSQSIFETHNFIQ